MPLSRRLRGSVIAAAVLVAGLVAPSMASAEIFRVFLKDGTALACYGEYARVDDRLVLTVPVGSGERTAYEFVSLPIAVVDLPRTERYAEAVRAGQFAATRGAAEFAALSDRLSRQLAGIETLGTPAERLASAQSARDQLVEWARASHGYRADEVAQLLQLFDSAIIDLRVAAGESRFAINLSATVVPDAPPRLRPAPTAAQSIQLALKAAGATDQPEIRAALLARARAAAARLPKTAATASVRAEVARLAATEARADVAYRQLAADIRTRAARAVDTGDVKGIEPLKRRVAAADRTLGRKRPALVAELETMLAAAADQAAEHRLVLDLWESQRVSLVAYRGRALALLRTIRTLAAPLRAVSEMTGPPLTTLVTAERQTGAMVATFAALTPPDGATTAHAAVARVVERADAALRGRHRAVATRSLPVAREAAAAAREALAGLVAADSALATLLQPPKAAR